MLFRNDYPKTTALYEYDDEDAMRDEALQFELNGVFVLHSSANRGKYSVIYEQ